MDSNLSRRNLLKFAVSAVFIGMLPSCATNSGKATPGPFMIDTKGVEDLNGFIAAIRKAGAGYLPREVTLEDYYKAFAKSFVENARKAVELGMQIPQWIMDKLPNKKVAIEKDDKRLLIAIGLLGLVFLVPITFFYMLILGAILTLAKHISDILSEERV